MYWRFLTGLARTTETGETLHQQRARITCSITALASATGSDLSGRCAFLAGLINTSSPVISPTQSPYLQEEDRAAQAR
jgi:hypothetical protein